MITAMFDFHSARELTFSSLLLRLALSVLIGGLLGFERGRQHRPAGFRTYVLVCLGSALIMMTNQFVSQTLGLSDPVRMGAQVISGIGFLGAGTIIVTRQNHVRGITTAAGMWTAAGCGLAVGTGFYEGALLGGCAVFFVMAVLRRVDGLIKRHTAAVEVYVELDRDQTLSACILYLREKDCKVRDIQLNTQSAGQSASLFIESRIRRSHHEMLTLIDSMPGLLFMQEL